MDSWYSQNAAEGRERTRYVRVSLIKKKTSLLHEAVGQ